MNSHWRVLRRIGPSVAGVLLALGCGANAARAATTFDSPSGNIRCIVSNGIACEVPTSGSCDGTFYLHARVKRTGAASVARECDRLFYDEIDFTLAYGKSISRSGVTCASRTTGMRCSNKAGHGFVVNRRGARRF